jgi:hypothetical protein
MYPTTYTGTQMISGSMFGSAYLRQRHPDETQYPIARAASRSHLWLTRWAFGHG